MSNKASLYLAGSSRELTRVLKYVEKLERSGVVSLVGPWWEAVQAHGVGRDAELTRQHQHDHACEDLEGVRSARLFWALFPDGHSHECLFEMGFAVADKSSRRLIVSGANVANCRFTTMSDFCTVSDDEAFETVLRMARERLGAK
jgi:hypothetical protein